MDWIGKGLDYFDSKEEWYFSWYLEELVSNGFVTDVIYQPDSYTLSEKQVVEYMTSVRNKLKDKEAFLLHPHVYTLDFEIRFSRKAEGLFIHKELTNPIGKQYPFKKVKNGSVYIDVKGSFVGKNNTSGITFPINQKWMYDKHNIYVQKIIPIKLFESTFTPTRYLTTDNSGKPRKIKFKPKSINEYIKICYQKN